MKIPWLRVLDTVIGVADIARTASGGRGKPEPPARDDLEIAGRMGPGGLEARLAGVVVAALKEAFDRDSRRLDLDRQQIAAERERAERALRLELQRQAADREIGRLRLLAGVAVTVWIGTLVLSTRLIAGGLGARASLGVGWLFLLGAIAASFVAQSHAAAAVESAAGDGTLGPVESSAAGALTLWLLLCGFVLVGVAALLA